MSGCGRLLVLRRYEWEAWHSRAAPEQPRSCLDTRNLETDLGLNLTGNGGVL